MPFTVPRAGEDVPAILWLPERPAGRRPLVLLGHGGGMHKQSPLIDGLGNWLAGGPGFACLAIDLPFHGERTPPDEVGLPVRERRSRLGVEAWRERNARATPQAVGPVVLPGVRYYVRRVPSPGDARWASVGLDV
jgi:hypothetical protein